MDSGGRMQQSELRRLRLWLLGSAVFLVLVIGAYIGLARYLRHRFLLKLPARLGDSISSARPMRGRTTRRCRGRTVYSIHAAQGD